MTAPRVSEEEATNAWRDLLRTGRGLDGADGTGECEVGSTVIRALLAERSALEARLAEARKAFAREALAFTEHARDFKEMIDLRDWLRAVAEGKC